MDSISSEILKVTVNLSEVNILYFIFEKVGNKKKCPGIEDIDFQSKYLKNNIYRILVTGEAIFS